MCPSGKSLTTQVADDLRSAFDVLDADHDGKISREDLHTFYSTATATATATTDNDDSLIETMISMADSNRDGYVQYEEFEHVMDEIRRPSSRGSTTSGKSNNDKSGSVMEDAFRVMDRDGDGRLSYEDLKGYMQWAGFNARDEDIKAMMRLGGGNDHGGVTYEGFLKILAMDDMI